MAEPQKSEPRGNVDSYSDFNCDEDVAAAAAAAVPEEQDTLEIESDVRNGHPLFFFFFLHSLFNSSLKKVRVAVWEW